MRIADRFLCLGAAIVLFYQGGASPAEREYVILKLKASEFIANYPTYEALNPKKSVKTITGKRVPTRHRSKEFVCHEISPPTASYEKKEAEILVLEKGQLKWRLRVKGFKGLDPEWVTEEVLNVEIWLGTSVQLNELINVETGQVLYRSALGHYDALKP